MEEWAYFIGENIIRLTVDFWTWAVIVIAVLSLPAPYLAFKLIRRNRCLGRRIYDELAHADRFMQIWVSGSPLLSDDSQYIWPFVPNGNKAAAHNSKIDDQLAKMKLIHKKIDHTTYDHVSLVEPRGDQYWLRNSIVFLLLLFLRVTIFGDKVSHIAMGGGRYTEKDLTRMYKITTVFLIVVFLSLILAIVTVF